MNGKNAPLAQLKAEFGDKGGKQKLVDAIVGLIDHGDEEKDSVRARLLKASNKKLLRLRASSAAIKEKYGSVERLAATVAEKLGHAKDEGFIARLGAYTPGRLLDLARSLAGEARRPLKIAAAAVSAAMPKKAAAPEPAAKKASAKKPVAKKPAAKGKNKGKAKAAALAKAAANKKKSAPSSRHAPGKKGTSKKK
jgi:pyruvate/2-oxoglutarate dehydrogenase complex dihydrolipoamide acyltransferase (E2) component